MNTRRLSQSLLSPSDNVSGIVIPPNILVLFVSRVRSFLRPRSKMADRNARLMQRLRDSLDHALAEGQKPRGPNERSQSAGGLAPARGAATRRAKKSQDTPDDQAAPPVTNPDPEAFVIEDDDDGDDTSRTTTPQPPAADEKDKDKVADEGVKDVKAEETGEKKEVENGVKEKDDQEAKEQTKTPELPSDVKLKLRKLEKLQGTYPGALSGALSCWLLTYCRATTILSDSARQSDVDRTVRTSPQGAHSTHVHQGAGRPG